MGTDRFFREAARLAKLQRALSEVGVADAVVQLLSAARDVAARSPYQRAIVPKLIELADEIMRFGDTALQDEFIAMAQAADFFLFSLRAQLKAFMAEVKRALDIGRYREI